MPYSTVASLPPAVRSKLKGKKLRQWKEVFNSSYASHGDESRAFAEAWSTVKKALSTKMTKDEAKYQGSPKAGERCSDCTMFVKPNGCTAVEGTISSAGWCKLFKKSIALGKAQPMSDFSFFLPIAKVDKDKRTVSGYASTPTKDADGEIVTLEAMKMALPDYMAWGNIREMHKLSAVGVAEEANVDAKGLFLTAKIVDDAAWKKCLEGVYKGFSIGGRKVDKQGNKITEIEMTEISVVDRPCNPDARFTLAKSAKEASGAAGAGGYLIKAKAPVSPERQALKKMAKAVEALSKGGPPAAHDGFSLPARPNGVVSPNDSRPNENVTRKTEDTPLCKDHGVANCPKCAVEKGGDAPGEGNKPYGDVEYADPGYQEDKKKRYPIDTEEHIRAAWNYINKPKNAAKYGENASKVKAKIIAAWKSKIDKEGPPAAKEDKKSAKKLAKARLAKILGLSSSYSFLTLAKPEAPIEPEVIEKGMGTAGSLAYCFDSIREAQRSLLIEAKREGGDMKDKKLAKQLGSVAQQLASIISQKAEHEGGEATDLSDVDDQYLTSILGEDFDMEKAIDGVTKTGDPIADAMATLMKRAAEPTKAMRMVKAQEDVKMSRKAMKAARSAIEEAHKLHKAAFLAKAAKGKKPDDKDDGEFDHADAMEKLQKAYQEIDKARTFGKAAMVQMAKAAGRSGQRGQEAGDGEAGVYEVPAGVKDLSPAAMAGASPGGGASGSQPPVYPVDGGVYPGKAAGVSDLQKFAKNGQIPAEVAALIMEKAQADGELAALRRLPAAGSGGRRPYAFDMNKIVAGSSNGNESVNKALFEGVDPIALGSGDERAHTEASAKVIGNFLTSGHFGKSVFDPAFKGAAGTGR